MPPKSVARSLAKAKTTKAAPSGSPALNSESQRRSMLKFNAELPLYACSSLGSFGAGAFVLGGGGGRAKTGVKNGIHVLVPPFYNSKCSGEGIALPFIDLVNLLVLSLCNSNGQLYATTAESIVAFGANVGPDYLMAETSRLSLNFAKSEASKTGFSSATANLKDAISKGASAEEQQQLSRAVDKAVVELDSQNVVTFVHRDTLHVMSSSGVWRIKDNGRVLVPEIVCDGHKHGRIKLTLSLNNDQFLCLCAAATATVGTASPLQQLLVIDAKSGHVAWTVPFTPSKSVRINSACVLRDHIYFITASATEGALWRCECKSSQPSSVPKQVLAFKAPAVCIATCSTRGIIAVGTADGSVHLVDPNSWRCHIRRIQAHKLSTTCIAVSGGMICSASLDRTVAVISIDYEIWFSQVMFILRIIGAVGVAFLLRWFKFI